MGPAAKLVMTWHVVPIPLLGVRPMTRRIPS